MCPIFQLWLASVVSQLGLKLGRRASLKPMMHVSVRVEGSWALFAYEPLSRFDLLGAYEGRLWTGSHNSQISVGNRHGSWTNEVTHESVNSK